MTPGGKQDTIQAMAEDFYRVMPCAPPVPFDDKIGWLWGEVEHNEHFQFCKLIATRIINWSWDCIREQRN